MSEDWKSRWAEGRTGWHEPEGNDGLKKLWPELPPGSRVLVPLCGKSPDLLWLAQRGCNVVGTELSGIAARGFFADSGLDYTSQTEGSSIRHTAKELPISIVEGDYFNLRTMPSMLTTIAALWSPYRPIHGRTTPGTRRLC